jgi:hypothetical protein
MRIPLRDLASVIRSKNSGPYELTLDVLFKDDQTYRRVADAGVLTGKFVAGLYGVPEESIVSVIEFPAARAIKVTMVRPIPSGALGERDVYGSQQHAPLLNAVLDLEDPTL